MNKHILPVAISLLIHIAVVSLILSGAVFSNEEVHLPKPIPVLAKIVDENPHQLQRKKKRLQQLAEKKRRLAMQKKKEQQRKEQQYKLKQQRKLKQQQEALAKQQEEERRRKEKERKQREQNKRRKEQAAMVEAERKRQELLLKDRENSLQQALLEEEYFQQEQKEEQMVGGYTTNMIQYLEDNWSIPPSAKTGMKALLEIHLVPTGEVVAVRVLESSGNRAFDRSAEQAVWKVRKFPEIQAMDNRLFEKYFRTFKLLFNPQELILR